jgi:hypothetical protein
MKVTAVSRLMEGRRAKYGFAESSFIGIADKMGCFWITAARAAKTVSFSDRWGDAWSV